MLDLIRNLADNCRVTHRIDAEIDAALAIGAPRDVRGLSDLMKRRRMAGEAARSAAIGLGSMGVNFYAYHNAKRGS